MNIAGYLARLGVEPPRVPSLDALRALHAAHVERVPYETFDLYRRRPPSIDPAESLRRIVDGRGGFCYHLNGAFALLLSALGFEITRHRAGVQIDPATPHHIDGNHLGLTVAGLPSPDNPGGRWLIDVGLGDALHQPLPLRSGRHRQGPFGYELHPSQVAPGGWRFDHDPRGSFTGFDVAPDTATLDDFAEVGHYLSTSPESPFVQLAMAQRRDGEGVDILRGCVLTRIDAAGERYITLDTRQEWYGVLAERFGLSFPDDDDAEALWRRVRGQHLRHERAAHGIQ